MNISDRYKHPKRKFSWRCFWILGLALPLVLVALFYALRGQAGLMLWWTETCLAPVAHGLGRLCSLLPFSFGEAFVVLFALTVLGLLGYRAFRFFVHRESFLRKTHLALIVGFLLWIWVLLSWMWNVLYYVPTFAQRSNLEVAPYPVEDLIAVTTLFAQEAQALAGEVPRDEALNFIPDQAAYFQQSLDLYQSLEQDYPFLAMKAVKPKSLALSAFQSHFGFTGSYSPFTGEANINTHSPAILHPATIAHEMAHQRLIAPELEANFLAVVACLDSPHTLYQYSGSLLGLMELSSALYSVDPQAWMDIVEAHFTPEISVDWQNNADYWANYQSPVESVAKEVYDSFLKSNDQELGIRSYGACVDLLVAYYLPTVETEV